MNEEPAQYGQDPEPADVVITACPICGGDEFALMGTRIDGVKVLECGACGMGVVARHPRFPLTIYGDSYFSAKLDTKVGYVNYEAVAPHSLSWVVRLVRLLMPSGAVLDVGCANGFLLAGLGPDYQQFGIEPNDQLGARCRQAGIEMIGRDICDPELGAQWDGRFDVITAMAVLEHVPDMKLALENMIRMLKNQGLILFETPLISREGNNSSWFTSSLEHIFYPTDESLRFVFQEVFGLPLIGHEVQIANYGSTFVGLATKDVKLHAQLSSRFDRLVGTAITSLGDPAERRFRFFFDLVYAAQVSPQTLSVLPELESSDVTPSLLNRLRELWNTEIARSQSMLDAIEHRNQQELAELIDVRARAEFLEADVERSAVELRAAQAENLEIKARYLKEVAYLRNELIAVERTLELRGDEDYETELQNQIAALQICLAESERERVEESQRTQEDLKASKEHVTALLESTSWRLTAPLRWAISGARAVGDSERKRKALQDRFLYMLYRRAPLSQSAKRQVVDLLRRRGLFSESRRPVTQLAPQLAPVEMSNESWPSDRPLVSVIIPAFNYGHFVAGAVDSVLAQTIQDFEILVVEGGSTDQASADETRKLIRPKTTVLWRDAPSLLGDNRNHGIARASGKYICCLDADDFLQPTYLEKALFLLEAQGFDVVSCSYEMFEEKSGVYRLMDRPGLAELVEGNHVAVCGVFRRSHWEQVGGYADTGLGEDFVYEDWRFWIRLAALGARFGNISREPLFRYRVHSKSLSHSAGLRASEIQREELMRLEREILTEEAFKRSRQRQVTPVKIRDPMANFKNRIPSDLRPTVIIGLPFLLVGGAERLLSEVSAHLSRCGYRIVIVTHLEVGAESGSSADWFTEATSEIYHLPTFLDKEAWHQFVTYLLETRNVKIVWIAGSQFFYDLLGEIRSKWPSMKVVDLLFNVVGHTSSNRKNSSLIDLNLVENQEVEDWLLEKGESPDRIRLIPSGVNLKRYQPVPKSPVTMANLKIPHDAFVVGFSGRFSEEKMPDTFVKLAGRLRHHANLVFVMTGAGPMEGRLRRQIDRLGLANRLIFVGNVPDVRDYLGIYDLLVVPSRLDGRPVVVMESMAMGVPVVASRVGGLPELIEEGVTGFLCDPSDIDSFMDRVVWMADHPEEVTQMRMAARTHAQEHFDADAMNVRYEQVLGSLAGIQEDPSGLEPQH